MRAVAFLRDKPARWRLAAVLAATAALAAALPLAAPSPAQPGQPTRLLKQAQPPKAAEVEASTVLVAPRPTPAYRLDLRPAFSKAVPTSLADLKSIEEHVKALSARVSPAVVAVEVGSGSGSGVIISRRWPRAHRRACLWRARSPGAAYLSRWQDSARQDRGRQRR